MLVLIGIWHVATHKGGSIPSPASSGKRSIRSSCRVAFYRPARERRQRGIDHEDIDPGNIGGPKMAGQGWRMLMECLAAGRSISLPSSNTSTQSAEIGFAQACASNAATRYLASVATGFLRSVDTRISEKFIGRSIRKAPTPYPT